MGLISDTFMPRARADWMSYDDKRAWTSTVTYSTRRTRSGEDIGPVEAMGLSAYFACIRNISEDLGKLPLSLYTRSDAGRNEALDHVAYDLMFEEFSPEMSAQAGREALLHWAMGWGSSFAEIVRDGRGRPRALYPIDPWLCAIKRRNGRLVLEIKGQTGSLYSEQKGQAGDKVLDMEDVFHLHGVGNGITGYSVAQIGAESLGRAMAAQHFGAEFFGNGAMMGMVFEHPENLSEDAQKNLQSSLDSHENWRPFVLEEGMKVSTYRPGIPPRDAQLIETEEFSVETVARWFRMPLSKIQYHKRAQGWSTLETLNTDYKVDTLDPWARRIEREAARKLLSEPERRTMYFEHNFDALLRGDSKTRTENQRELIHMGALTPNEVRAQLNMPPIPGESGNQFYMQSAMTTLEKIAAEEEEPEPQPFGMPPQQQPDEDQPDDREDPDVPADDEDEARASATPVTVTLRPMVEYEAMRMCRKEAMAVSKAVRRFAADTAGFEVWADDFYSKHAETMVEAFGPAAESWSLGTGNALPALTIWAAGVCRMRRPQASESFRAGAPVPGSEPTASQNLADSCFAHFTGSRAKE